MITVAEAWRRILENVPTLGTENISVPSSIGRVLAEPIYAPLDLPIFTNSAVDGYAVRSHETESGKKLEVVGAVAAGDRVSDLVKSDSAIRVFTGSQLPSGADAVVMQEDVEVDGTHIHLCKALEQGANVRHRAEEVKKGELVLQPGSLISPATLGVLSTLGIANINVYMQPRVAVIGTGSELVPAGRDLQPGQIYESNTLAISSALQFMNAIVVRAIQVDDKANDIEGALSSGLSEADVVITCGGVSVGEHDLVRAAAARLSVKEVFWRVAMRPGRPFYFGVSDTGKPVFGLPGNPVSALITFYVLVRPALRKMLGLGPEEGWHWAKLGAPYKKAKGREEFVRAKCVPSAELTVAPIEQQGSHMLTGLAEATYLIHLPEFLEKFETGDQVTVKKMQWGLV